MNFLNKAFILIIMTAVITFYGTNYPACAETYTAQVSKNHTKIENLIERGKYSQAEEYVKKLLDKNPGDIRAKGYLGALYSAQYKLDAAEKKFKKILAEHPENAFAHNGLGMVYYRRTTSSDMQIRKNIREYYNKAFAEFKLATDNDPNFYKAYDNAGKILMESGRINDAERFFKKALEIRPDYSASVENYGKVLFAKNRIDAAADKYKEAIRLNSKNSSAYYNLGEALIRKGDLSEAIKQLQISLYLFSNSAPVHDLLGRAYELQGNEAAAVSEYKKSFLIKPEYLPPYLRLADIYRNRGDDEIAVSELRNALSINPDFNEAKLKIADTSLNIRKTEQAIKYYKDLLNVPNYKVSAVKGLSKAYFERAKELNTTAAIASESDYIYIENALKEAIKYDPNTLELYLALLRVSKISHKEDQSAFYMKSILDTPQNSIIGHVIKGEAYLVSNDYNNAEREFLNAMNRTNNNEDLLKLAEIFTTNRAYVSAKNAVYKVFSNDSGNLKAKRILERIRKNEDEAASRLKTANAFAAEKQRTAAIEVYLDVLDLNACLPEAHLNLAKVFEKERYYYNAVNHYTAYLNLIDISRIREREKYTAKIEKLKRKISKIETKKKNIKKYKYTNM